MNAACSRVCASVIAVPKLSQLFQPIGGVGAQVRNRGRGRGACAARTVESARVRSSLSIATYFLPGIWGVLAIVRVRGQRPLPAVMTAAADFSPSPETVRRMRPVWPFFALTMTSARPLKASRS